MFNFSICHLCNLKSDQNYDLCSYCEILILKEPRKNINNKDFLKTNNCNNCNYIDNSKEINCNILFFGNHYIKSMVDEIYYKQKFYIIRILGNLFENKVRSQINFNSFNNIIIPNHSSFKTRMMGYSLEFELLKLTSFKEKNISFFYKEEQKFERLLDDNKTIIFSIKKNNNDLAKILKKSNIKNMIIINLID